MELHEISSNLIGTFGYFWTYALGALLFLGIASVYKLIVFLSLLMKDLPLLRLEECMFSLLMMDLDLPRLINMILFDSLSLVMFFT